MTHNECRNGQRSFPARAVRLALAAMIALSTPGNFGAPLNPAAPPEAGTAEVDLEGGRRALERGDFQKAIPALKSAQRRFEKGKKIPESLVAAGLLAQANQALGHHQESVALLSDALETAEKAGASNQVRALRNSLGVGLTLLRQTERAETVLQESLEAGRQAGDDAAVGNALVNFGNLASVQGRPAVALGHYVRAGESADALSNFPLSANAWANAAAAALMLTNHADAERFNQRAVEAAGRLEPSHTQASLHLRAAQTFRQIAAAGAERRARSLPRAQQAAQRALEIADSIGDLRSGSAALGALGKIYESDGRAAEALTLTRRAIFAAQKANDPDALFQWEWQSGRLLKAMGEREGAIGAYRRSVQTLRGIRNDLALGYGNRLDTGSFRETTGAVYFELADLLLEQSEREQDPKRRQIFLVEARDTIELLRSAEMEDYFRDECVTAVRAKAASIEKVEPRTAVIYSIPFADRLELLVGLGEEWKRFQITVTERELEGMAGNLRQLLEKRTTSQFLQPSQRLHELLIKPLLPDLQTREVDTLVFILDGALRKIPMAALHDGESFLINHFAIATTPGMTLTDPTPLKRQKSSLLLSGLSKAVQGFSALNYVPDEMQTVRTNYTSKVLLNEMFSLANVQKEFEQSGYSLVHIASHGQFDRDPKKCFLLTHDKKLTLDDLEKLIRPGQYHGRPVELLTLSACQTAAGDDRAALGLAGVAIKAGARSALATQWFVNDQASVTLISEFYSQMRGNPELSKAKALQAAQVRLIQDARFRHPCYWAPYLMIGNWL